jgi:2-C-methyl-D-erythritol 2,4-cyclodiphosphate synthase
MEYRIGFGYDVHQLVEGRDLMIGGIQVPHYKGALGHSDADVLIHAICDAMLGAANMRDIGYQFPDSDEKYKGIDSKILLRDTIKLIAQKGLIIGNIDATVCLQKPKIMDLIPDMQSVLAHIMSVDSEYVSIKATTTERMGFVGTEAGISAYAVVLLKEIVA